MAIRVAINGFGRIGRNVLRVIMTAPSLKNAIEVVSVNDLTDPKTLAHLLKYDSIHGRYPGKIGVDGQAITVDGKRIEVLSERDPLQLPWKKLKIDVAIESTGIFVKAEGPKGGYIDHIKAGAKKVILTVPAKDDIPTMVLGVNESDYSPEIKAWSNASCTTNCLAPLAKVLNDTFGIVRGMMTTVHAYTNDQRILDFPHEDLRRARAANLSIIPTSTGAARAVSLVIPELKGKLDGMAMRVPTPNGSVVDLVCELKKPVTQASVNQALKDASEDQLKGILAYTEDPIVSRDIVGDPHSSIIDGLSTMVIGPMVKVISWYDNEWGYSNRVVDLIRFISH